ncbi:MAG: response regulator transcription factor [Anaerolineales bacterium]|nr:response regulator transcription factor [Anaerolineales bacterium]
MIRVLICDDQEIICEGLEKILGTDPEIQVVGIALDGREAIEKVRQNPPDVVLMDLKMPGTNGVQATRAIRQAHPETRVLVLTTYDEDEWLFDAIRSGASGYLLKDTPRHELLDAVKGTALGKSFVDPAVMGKILAHVEHGTPSEPAPTAIDLSQREREILRLLARGLANADIAHQLFLSEGTVRNYTSALFEKLGVSDRTQAALVALKMGLVDLDE